MSLAAGTRLGPYEILAPIGAGGMGEVYRARDPRLTRDVAVKVLPASVSHDPSRLRRFEQEARAAGVLNHPNITAVHDIGTHGGAPYIVTELLEGETLRSRLAGSALPVRKAIEYALQILRGLAAAHEKGIVHRDLKPENLFVTKDGRLKILDFGLAKLVEPAAAGEHTNLPTAPAATEPGTVLGTLGYMSPEQLRGKPADHRSDIFSFGSVLYEMLAGQRAFRGDTAADTMSAILREDPPDLAATNRGIAPGLERIVRHCLEKNPEERFQSAHDLAFDLEALSVPVASSERAVVSQGPVDRGRRWTRALAASGLVTGAVLCLLAGRWWGDVETRRDPPVFRRLTFRRGNLLGGRFAPDGHTLVYGAAFEGHPGELFTVRLDGTESRPLGIKNADLLAVSSTGELAILLKKGNLANSSGAGTLARVSLSGGAPREVADGVLRADWTPDGGELAVLRVVGDRVRVEFPAGRMVHEGNLEDLRVSPRGDRVAFCSFEEGRGSVCVADRAGAVRVLATATYLAGGIAWSPAGDEVYFTGGESLADQPIRAVSLSGRQRILFRGPGDTYLNDSFRDGRLLVEHASSRSGIFCQPPGESREREVSWLDASLLSALSADGTAILFGETSVGSRSKGDVFFRRVDGSPAVRLSDGAPQDLSPDGRWALVLTRDTPRALLLVPVGAGEPRKLPTAGLAVAAASFLPDGKMVLVQASETGGGRRGYLLGLDGGPPRAFTPEGISALGAASPDGRLVAVVLGTGRVILQPVDGGTPRPLEGLAPGDRPVQWSADGRFLYLETEGQLPMRVDRWDLAAGKRVHWKELMPADASGVIGLRNVRVTPDGRAYAYTYARVTSSDLYVVEGLVSGVRATGSR